MMGIGKDAFNLYIDLFSRGFFNKIKSVMELGSQEIHISDKKNLLLFLKSIGIKNPEAELKRALKQAGKRSIKYRLLKPYHLGGKRVYKWFGVKEYASIDLNGAHNSYKFNLNKDIRKAYNYRKTFDLVTNLGTTEHVFDQYSSFRNIHNMTKVGGYMLHLLPFRNSANHSFYSYNPIFFMDMATTNKYEFKGMWISVNGEKVVPYSKKIMEKYLDNGEVLFLYCLLRKTGSVEFKMPIQSRISRYQQKENFDYSEMRKNLKFVKSKKPFWIRAIKKVLNIKL